MAFKVLGPGILDRPYTAELRRRLWTTDHQERETLKLRGKHFFSEPTDSHALAMLHWPGAWMIALNAFPEGFGVTVVTPGGHHLAIMAAEGHEGWAPEAGPTYGDGKVYLVVPQRQMVVGPIEMIEYCSYKAGLGRSAPLEHLKGLEVPLSDLPPKR